MESSYAQGSESPSRNSYIGSYYQPPDQILPIPRILDFPVGPFGGHQTSDPQRRPTIENRAVLEAMQTLQGKIKRLEKERKQTERRYQQVTHDSIGNQPSVTTHTVDTQTPTKEAQNVDKKELDSKLQAAESRCQVLGKQLEYMRNMVETAKGETKSVKDNQATVQKQESSRSESQSQREKLKKLEAEYLKLSKTQNLAGVKLALLEQRLLKEQAENKAVHEKASELQRDLDRTRQLMSPSKEPKPRKPTKSLRTSGTVEFTPRGRVRHKQMPFVAGTSTSPSHSVHANVQGILHLMKHHQPHLCERISALQRPGNAAKKNLQKRFSSHDRSEPSGAPEQTVQCLESLSDILLALQDELGRMSFEQQELVSQMESAANQEQRGELQRELETLANRMEEKGAHITKLRQHRQAVLTLKESRSSSSELQKRRPSAPSPVRPKQSMKSGPVTQKNLQILRETQKLRSCLKQDDLLWET